jgi:hypothetical protein
VVILDKAAQAPGSAIAAPQAPLLAALWARTRAAA